MGVSSDGILYFGFQVGGEEQKPDWLPDTEAGDRMEFDNWLLKIAGVSEDAPYEERRKVTEASPVVLEMFCSYDYPMYVLVMRGKELRAARGDLDEVTSEFLSVKAEEIAAAKAWCEANGIPWEEPKWLLCSMYG